MHNINDIINKVHHADCLEFMKGMPDGCVDLVLTDPPYGLGFDYTQFDDTQANIKVLIDSFMPELIRISKRVVLTCGHTNMWHYPKPTWVLSWVIPAGNNMNSWGFTCWHPILVYGKDPYQSNGLGARSDIIIHTESSPKVDHPCPKPINLIIKLLNRSSVDNKDIIFDPFCGSGTTLVAAKMLGRRWVGIDIEKKYCDMAEERLRNTTPPLPFTKEKME